MIKINYLDERECMIYSEIETMSPVSPKTNVTQLQSLKITVKLHKDTRK